MFTTTRRTVRRTPSTPRRKVLRHPGRRNAALAAAALLALGAVSCGSDDDGEDTDPAAPVTVTASAGPATTERATSPAVTPTADPPTVTVTPSDPPPDPDPEDPPYVPGDCSIDSLHRSAGTEDLDTLIWCDGLWMRAGQWRTDHVRNFYLGGYLWREFVADGTSDATGYPCYSQGRLDRENVPAGLQEYLMVCEEVNGPSEPQDPQDPQDPQS